MRRTVIASFALAAALALGSSAPTAARAAQGEEPVLGPEGYKSLHLGQPGDEAEATGLLVDRQPGDCDRYYLHPDEGEQNVGSGVFVDPSLGVVLIGGTTLSHTPEDVTMGTHLDTVRAAYPDLAPVPPTDFVYETAVPGHPGLQYRFAFSEGDRVSDFALHAEDMGACASGGADTGFAAAQAPGEVPVLFVHGYDSGSAKDCEDTFDAALGYFEANGRDRSSLVTVGYYDGDSNCDIDVTDDGTDNGTRIKDIASDLANHVYDNYTSQGRSVDVVAHSMGGLVTRVALLGAAQGWEGFPAEPLLVGDVVTLGTPHQGVRCESDGGENDECPDTTQWRSMDPDSTFMQVLHSPSHRLDEEWASAHDWTFVGSAEDEVVSYDSAIDRARPADHKFGYQGGDREGTVTHAAIRRFFSGDFNLHYWHAAEGETHATDNGWAPLEAAFHAVDRDDDW